MWLIDVTTNVKCVSYDSYHIKLTCIMPSRGVLIDLQYSELSHTTWGYHNPQAWTKMWHLSDRNGTSTYNATETRVSLLCLDLLWQSQQETRHFTQSRVGEIKHETSRGRGRERHDVFGLLFTCFLKCSCRIDYASSDNPYSRNPHSLMVHFVWFRQNTLIKIKNPNPMIRHDQATVQK